MEHLEITFFTQSVCITFLYSGAILSGYHKTYVAGFVESIPQSTETIHELQEGLFLGALSTAFIWFPAELSIQTFLTQKPLFIQDSLFYFWAFQMAYSFLGRLKIPQGILFSAYEHYTQALLQDANQ